MLYQLLRELELATPDALLPYLECFSEDDVERRPFAEQMVDQLLAEDQSRYEIYENLRQQIDGEVKPVPLAEKLGGPQMQAAIGHFLSKWITLEGILRERFTRENGEKPTAIANIRRLYSAANLDKEMQWEIDHIRRIRNNLVHGIEIPDMDEIQGTTAQLDTILKRISKLDGPPPANSSPRAQRRRKPKKE